MKQIQYINYKQFIQDISKYRDNLYKKEFELLNKECKYVDINNFCELPNGRFNTKIGNAEFECIFKMKEKTKLYVFLSGACNIGETLPIFRRWSYSSIVNGCSLSIADPMLKKFPELQLGWYFGTAFENYYEYIVEIVQKIASYLNVENENIVFLASSGGGYAALQCSFRIDGSTAIVINPQIDIESYGYIEKFKRITGNSVGESDVYKRNDLMKKLFLPSSSKYIFVENCRSEEDMTQIDKMCKIIDKKFEFGIQQLTENILLWVYDANSMPYHNAQEYPQMLPFILKLPELFGKVEIYEDVYTTVTEMWYEHYCALERTKTTKDIFETGVVELESYIDIDFRKRPYFLLQDKVDIQGLHKYDFKEIYSGFENNKIYGLFIDEADFGDNICNSYTILIKNISNATIVYSKHIRTKKSCVVYFKTQSKASELSLRIYPNTPELSENAFVSLKGVRLCLINSLDY